MGETKKGGDADAGRTIVHTITLKHPITLPGGRVVERLEFEELEAGHLWDLPAQGVTMGHNFTVAARLANEPPAVLKRLRAADMGAVNEYMLVALGPFLSAGEESSGP